MPCLLEARVCALMSCQDQLGLQWWLMAVLQHDAMWAQWGPGQH